MALTKVWGFLCIVLICPMLGGLPIIDWLTRFASGRQLQRLGTGNISVSAAFYHGGTVVGVLAVISEALKGIAAVLVARFFFPTEPVWEIIALIALVMGRYWFAKGAGTTNVFWGIVTHDWETALIALVISGVGFTLLRERQTGRLGALVVLSMVMALRHPNEPDIIGATVLLCGLMGWIYQKIPDDLDQTGTAASPASQRMFSFFRGDRAIRTLDHALKPNQVGAKAATLAQLKRWGYPVPQGWVLPPTDDPQPLIAHLDPSPDQPLVVRSSAIGEDSETASAAGQYESILDITNRWELEGAIAQCQTSYNAPPAVQYRRDRQIRDSAMTVLVQRQVQGVFSGVAFSRDPISRCGDAVVIEALPGRATRVVSGRVTPEQYRVWVSDRDLQLAPSSIPDPASPDWVLPDHLSFDMEGQGDVPHRLIQRVAYLVRHLEQRFHGIPQDVEWSFDGEHLWVLQSRPIPTLLPIWTRKIAAEVIPGLIHPLTWSINRPLTCGVWGDLFTVVLGDRARGLNFEDTATLHHSAAYFNASLLGHIFLRMGLPPESLEFLTRGAKFRKPPLSATLRALPGLLRLLVRELVVAEEFDRDDRQHFQAAISEFRQYPPQDLSPGELIGRIHDILSLLRRATYYNILVPLSVALRQALLRVPDSDLNYRVLPEVASMQALQAIAQDARRLLSQPDRLEARSSTVLAAIAEIPDGTTILRQLDQFLQIYGHLSEVGTDIAVPTWKEDPNPVREAFARFVVYGLPNPVARDNAEKPLRPSWKAIAVQPRLVLKGRVAEVYSHLLAELRWSFLALEEHHRHAGGFQNAEDIFFLTVDEVEQLFSQPDAERMHSIHTKILERRSHWEQDRHHTPPSIVYGNDPPRLYSIPQAELSQSSSQSRLYGIAASPGWAEGRIKVLKTLQADLTIPSDTILVVPYTDAGWAPILTRAAGLISEVGGRLSHGAIVAREYGIPAVMDVYQATQVLKDGQRVRIDGATGMIEVF
jgi:pyruvate,water dikinase